jgi:tetratricopeptide (TPR) repeat protein/predicted Zn-dependent protease
VPANRSAWLPAADQKAASGFQGSFVTGLREHFEVKLARGFNMRAAVCLALLVIACQNNKDLAPPAPAKAAEAAPAEVPEDAAQKELRRFLDGMLITTDVPPPQETVWPSSPAVASMDMDLPWFNERFGLQTKEQARAFIDVPPEQMDSRRLDFADRIRDGISELLHSQAALRKNPADEWSALELAQVETRIGDSEQAFNALAAVPPEAVARLGNRAYFEHLRCLAAFHTARYPQAVTACNLAGELDEALGYRTLVKVLLAMGKKREGLAQAKILAAKPERGRDPKLQLTLGVAQQANGQDEEALATWSLAHLRWPQNALLGKAVHGPRRTVLEWEKEEQAIELDQQARFYARCGLLYSELGMNGRSELCYQRSSALAQGPALAAQLVHLGASDQPAALAKALEAVKADPHPNLMTAVAWLYKLGHKPAEAKEWVQKALAAAPEDVKATSLMWELCGDEKDYLCVIRYRKRLGVSTHFDVAQYQSLRRVMEEEAEKNGLAAPELDSASLPKPPPLSSIVVVPVGNRVAPELAGMAEYLSGQFPGVKVSLGAREELQPGVIRTDRDQVIWERLLERLRDEPGRIYVLEDDLATADKRFVFAAFDLAHARGAVSLARFRDLVGDPRVAGTTWSGPLLSASRDRVRTQMAAATGKLLGLSFPCTNETCALHERRSVKDFYLGPEALCPKHLAELQARSQPQQNR